MVNLTRTLRNTPTGGKERPMTTHEFDTHCDITGWQPEDDSLLLMEQERDFYEMEAAKETALKKAGAREALGELKHYLLLCAVDDRCRDEFFGLKWSIDAITRRLSDIEISVARALA